MPCDDELGTDSERERFWTQVDQSGDCWIWTGTTFSSGYGYFRIRGKGRRAHRVAFATRQPIPEGMCVLHMCDNKPCVRPDHLFLGTQQDNVADRVAKGRSARGRCHGRHTNPDAWKGERNGRAKLTEEQVLAVRKRYASGGVTMQALADSLGVSRTAVKHVIQRKTWQAGEDDTVRLKLALRRMQDAADRFYASATHIGNHPWIEFTGLMNEYIKMCSDASEEGIDFTQANTHTGQAIPMQDYQAAYLGEKVGCIYGPALGDPAIFKAFFVSLDLPFDIEIREPEPAAMV